MATGAGLHIHPLPQQLAPDLSAPQTVYVILSTARSVWDASARVVAVHFDEDKALADLKTFREFSPNRLLGLFVQLQQGD